MNGGHSRRLAVDVGGTFVDAVTYDDELGLGLEKSPTTPDDPVRGIVEAIEKTGDDLANTESFVHGTTLGINAFLEREGAVTGVLTNEGFRDVLEIGRLTPPKAEMYNIWYPGRDLLVPRRRRRGVPGRLDADGEVTEPLDEGAVVDTVDELVEDHGIESLAVCFLHAYQNPEHERRVQSLVAEHYPELSVSVSSDISTELREYERTSTTTLDAYIKPVFRSYIERLDDRLDDFRFDGTFFITRSGGGALSAANAIERPVETVLSGPAGGVIGAASVGEAIGREHLLTVDMGGTSLDACVVHDGEPTVAYEAGIEDVRIQIPVYDIRTVGAGGGSIAWIDGSLLKVGPKSAGADPGPICYGRGGTEPTLTDAALVLGYLDPNAFLGGEMPLDGTAAREGIETSIAEPLGQSVREASIGVLRVMVAKTVGTLREVTVERGLDPREFTTIAFGGAGPMVVPTICRELGVREIVVPHAPSVFSAWGMLMTDVVYNHTVSLLSVIDQLDLETVEDYFRSIEIEGLDQLGDEGFGESEVQFERTAEIRYLGQEHSVEVAAGGIDSLSELRERFETEHEARYGHAMDDPAEVVYLRSRAIGVLEDPTIEGMVSSGAGGDPVATTGSREAYCFASERRREFDVVSRGAIAPGDVVDGPAIIQEPTTTTVFHSDQSATVDEHGHLVIVGGSP